MKAVSQSPSIDIMMYHMGFHPVTRWGEGRFSNESFLKPAADAMQKAGRETRKPVILALGPASDAAGTEEQLKVQEGFVKAGLPVFRSIEKAGLAMARVEAWWRRFSQTRGE
jgi:hypothetical protein